MQRIETMDSQTQLELLDSEAQLEMLKEQGSVHHLEIGFRMKSGELRRVQLSAEFVAIDGEECRLTPAEDIIRQEPTEEALRRSEERFRTILDNIEDAYWELDLSGKTTLFNDCTARLHGRSREELMGLDYRTYMDEESAARVAQMFRRVYETGEPARGLSWEIVRSDGARRTLEANVSLMRDAEGNAIGFRGVSRDISERKEADQALRQSEERYRTIIDNMEDAYWETDLAGRFTFFNNQVVVSHRRSREQLMGLRNKEYMDDEEAVKRVGEVFKHVYLSGEPMRAHTFEVIRGDGTRFHNETSISLIRNSEG